MGQKQINTWARNARITDSTVPPILFFGAVLLALAGLLHASWRPDLVMLTASRMAAWLACTLLLCGYHRLIRIYYPGFRSLDLWVRLAAGGFTLLWGVAVFHPAIARGTGTAQALDYLFAAGFLTQSASLALLVPWLPASILPRAVPRLVVFGVAISHMPIAHVSPPVMTGSLLLLTGVLAAFPCRSAVMARPAPATHGLPEEVLLRQLFALTNVLSLPILPQRQLLQRP